MALNEETTVVTAWTWKTGTNNFPDINRSTVTCPRGQRDHYAVNTIADSWDGSGRYLTDFGCATCGISKTKVAVAFALRESVGVVKGSVSPATVIGL